jgi:hypothetical protein
VGLNSLKSLNLTNVYTNNNKNNNKKNNKVKSKPLELFELAGKNHLRPGPGRVVFWGKNNPTQFETSTQRSEDGV